ncbi:hypothetical protein ACGFNP_51120 [Nonomuraea sp. NPDC049269]|uniref:hypothetical protein n=1 Tax=Nonomuraea sp. NPDC049269 TaxID=3364349 RepID=UPI003723DFD8
MWIKHAAAIATALTLATTPADCGKGSTTHPAGRHGCVNSWGPLTVVQLGTAEPRVERAFASGATRR